MHFVQKSAIFSVKEPLTRKQKRPFWILEFLNNWMYTVRWRVRKYWPNPRSEIDNAGTLCVLCCTVLCDCHACVLRPACLRVHVWEDVFVSRYIRCAGMRVCVCVCTCMCVYAMPCMCVYAMPCALHDYYCAFSRERVCLWVCVWCKCVCACVCVHVCLCVCVCCTMQLAHMRLAPCATILSHTYVDEQS